MQNSASLSPIKVKRRDEQTRLQSLNTRLQNYALRVGEQFHEKQNLSETLQMVQKRHAKEIEDLKNRYEKDLLRLQNDLDEETDQRARLQVLEQEQFQELKNLRPEAEQARELKIKVEMLKSQLKAEEDKTKTLEEDLSTAKLEISAVKRRASSLEKENKKFTSSNQRLHHENDKLKEEISKFSTRNDDELLEIKQDYAQKLEAIQIQAKNDHQQRIDTISSELNQHYGSMLEQHETRITELTKENEGLKKELNEITKDYEKSIAGQEDAFERIKVLEFEIRVERMKRKEERSLLEADLHKTRQARIELEKRFNELMDVKIALDAEISAYSSILEREESRVGIDTPKKRAHSPEQQKSAKKLKFCPAIELVQLDVKQESITAENKGDSDVDLTGWYLKSLAEDFQYQFPKNYVLKAGSRVTIWSGRNNKNKKHWPTDIFWTNKFVWNNQGDAALLLSPEGIIVSKISEGYNIPPQDSENVYDSSDEVELEDKKGKCTIM